MKNKHTEIEDDIFVCNDCGASANKPKNIEHYASCKVGDAEYWQRFYATETEESHENDE